MKTIRAAFALSLVLLCGTCRSKDSGRSASGEVDSRPRSNASETYEDKFRIGRVAAADGVVTNETDRFIEVEPIYISFVIRNAPAEAFAKVIWRRVEGNVMMAQDQKPLPPSGFVSFAVKDTSAWLPGAYRLEKMYSSEASAAPTSWKGIGTKDLTILPR